MIRRWWELVFGLPLAVIVEGYKWSIIFDKFDVFVDWVDRWLFRAGMAGAVIFLSYVVEWVVR